MFNEMTDFHLNGKQELEPILRWEDDGGQMTDEVALQSSQQHTEQPEKLLPLTHESVVDLFHTKLLRIQPM
ncbi:MAG: hypothetical protein Q8L87_05270 [Anaerolineales bacterium]|jgi:hypothetical protein|nr:hypothetical protein [Anaerolineales bacterium]